MRRGRARDGRVIRQHVREFALMPLATLARHLITRGRDARVLDVTFKAAQRITPDRNLKKLTVETRGRFRFHDKKPDLEQVRAGTATNVVNALKGYMITLNASRRRTFDRFSPADVAFELVGTGSVGTRDHVVLMDGHLVLAAPILAARRSDSLLRAA